MARRIELEREKRGWTYEGLAKRMTDVGCPINQSASYKVEQAQPRRRITVDELVALSRVFEMPLKDLLTDPKLLAFKTVVPLLKQWRELEARQNALIREPDAHERNIRLQLQAVAAQSTEAAEAVSVYWSTWAEELEFEGDLEGFGDRLGERMAAPFLPKPGSN